jgi:hypothetical protein
VRNRSAGRTRPGRWKATPGLIGPERGRRPRVARPPCSAGSASGAPGLSVGLRPIGLSLARRGGAQSRGELLAQVAAGELAHLVERQLIMHLHPLRRARRPEPAARVPAQLLLSCPCARKQHHDRHHQLAPLVVGDPDDGRVRHRRMVEEHRLDLPGREVLAAPHDHVVEPAVHEQEAVHIQATGVAGVEPAVLGRRRGPRRPEVLARDLVAPHPDLPHLARRERPAERIDGRTPPGRQLDRAAVGTQPTPRRDSTLVSDTSCPLVRQLYSIWAVRTGAAVVERAHGHRSPAPSVGRGISAGGDQASSAWRIWAVGRRGPRRRDPCAARRSTRPSRRATPLVSSSAAGTGARTRCRLRPGGGPPAHRPTNGTSHRPGPPRSGGVPRPQQR